MGPPSSGEEFGDILGRYLAETYTSVRRLEIVSYTHLDVYKRQPLGQPEPAPALAVELHDLVPR